MKRGLWSGIAWLCPLAIISICVSCEAGTAAVEGAAQAEVGTATEDEEEIPEIVMEVVGEREGLLSISPDKTISALNCT